MVMRLTGIASGMDTEAMIQKLMQAQRIPMDKLSQKKQTFEWQRDTYREVNTRITEFRNNMLFNMKLESNLAPKKATISGDSKAVQATAAGNASPGTILLDVQSLANSASNYSSSKIGTVDFKSGNLLSAGHVIDPNAPLTDPPATLAMQATYTFKINGKEISVNTAEDTLDSVITKINRDTNVTAFYDEASGKLSLMSKMTGSVNGVLGDGDAITLEGDFLTDVLKISSGSINEVKGVNAKLTVNGMLTERASNSFSINGVQITLVEANTGPVTINVTNDVDTTVNKIKEFITSYNETLKYLQDLSNEPKYRSFQPLTTEQRAAMSEKEIETWEKQAKSGLLRRDPIIANAISSIRSAITSVMDTGNPDYKVLSSLGIVTGSYSDNGKLYLNNEGKLRKALEADPEAVMKMFTSTGDEDGSRKNEGIASRMHIDLKNNLDLIATKAGRFLTLYDESPLSKQILGVADDIDVMNRRLSVMETKYYRQFAAMEAAINKMNSQSASLASSFGGTAQ